MKHDRVFIETDPFTPDEPDGTHKGVIHKHRDCPSVNDGMAVYPTFDNEKWEHYTIKIGRGAWLKVKKDVRCPDCFCDN